MTQEKGSAFLTDGRTVRLGTFTVQVTECPLPRIKQFQKLWGQYFETINRVQAMASDAAESGEGVSNEDLWQQVFDMVFESPYDLLHVVIPTLPKEPFEDEDEGVTIPQIFDAFDVILEVNRLGWLRKLTPFFQNMILNIDPTQFLTGTGQTGSTPE